MIQSGKFVHNEIIVEGVSLAGIRTSLTLPRWGVGLDVAQGLPHALNMKSFLISHGHMDHAAGIPYIISQKAMNSQAPANFYMPEMLVEPMTQIMQTWSLLEGHEYSYHFIPTKPGDQFELKPGLKARAFQTIHRVSSLGYTLYSEKKKLKSAFQGLPREELIELRDKGTEINEFIQMPLVSFTGDTQIEVLDQDPDLKKSKVLLIECTYIDEKRTVDRAREWGHLHLDELIPRLPELENEKICLIHLSSRYQYKEALSILDRRIPHEFKDRVCLFPGR